MKSSFSRKGFCTNQNINNEKPAYQHLNPNILGHLSRQKESLFTQRNKDEALRFLLLFSFQSSRYRFSNVFCQYCDSILEQT